MASASEISRDLGSLGTLGVLPREIRDQIYALVLDMRLPQSRLTPPHRTSLLRTTRDIYSEAVISLYQNNSFSLDVGLPDQDDIYPWPSFSGEQVNDLLRVPKPSFEVRLRHWSRVFTVFPKEWEHVREVALNIGDLTKSQIDEAVTQRTHGEPTSNVPSLADRNAGQGLASAIECACHMLRDCHQLHYVRVSVLARIDRPRGLRLLIAPICALRNIKDSQVTIGKGGFLNELVPLWRMKSGYVKYLKKVMALPEGSMTPEFIEVKQSRVYNSYHSSFDDMFELAYVDKEGYKIQELRGWGAEIAGSEYISRGIMDNEDQSSDVPDVEGLITSVERK